MGHFQEVVCSISNRQEVIGVTICLKLFFVFPNVFFVLSMRKRYLDLWTISCKREINSFGTMQR